MIARTIGSEILCVYIPQDHVPQNLNVQLFSADSIELSLSDMLVCLICGFFFPHFKLASNQTKIALL